MNVRKLRNKAIPVSLPQIPPVLGSIPLDRLSEEDETHDMIYDSKYYMCNSTHGGLNASSELDMDQGGGIGDQLRFVIKQLGNRIKSHTCRFLEDKYGDAPSDITLNPNK